MTAADSDHRLASLAALRGLAILLVVIAHLAPGGLTQFVGFVGHELMAYGGVILFFVLSGFLMDHTLQADRSLPRYVIRRAARILPLYWISLLIVLALGSWTLRDLTLNAFFLVPFGGGGLMSGVYWTLYVEVLFYALAPFLVYAGDRAILAGLWLLVAADVAVHLVRGAPSHALYHLTFCLLGMQFGAWYRGRLGNAALALAVAAVALHAGFLSPFGFFVAFAPLASALLMWIALRRAMSIAPLSFLGAVSYGWYLLHAVIGIPLMTAMQGAGWDAWPAALFAALVTLLLSWGAHVAVEQPGIAFGRRLQFAARKRQAA